MITCIHINTTACMSAGTLRWGPMPKTCTSDERAMQHQHVVRNHIIHHKLFSTQASLPGQPCHKARSTNLHPTDSSMTVINKQSNLTATPAHLLISFGWQRQPPTHPPTPPPTSRVLQLCGLLVHQTHLCWCIPCRHVAQCEAHITPVSAGMGGPSASGSCH